MAEIPAQMAAESALLRQAVSMSVIKQNADMQQKLAEIIQQSLTNVPVSASRGTNVNVSA